MSLRRCAPLLIAVCLPLAAACGRTADDEAPSSSTPNRDLPACAAARGAPDPDFGNGGSVEPFESGTYLRAADVDPAGHLFVLGASSSNGPTVHEAVARVLPSGRLDPGFGTRGIAAIDDVRYGFTHLVAQQDGKVLLIGQVLAADAATMVVARLQADGTPDPSFGTAGASSFEPSFVSLWDAAIDSDGRLLLVGTMPATPSPWVFRITRDGAVDPSFAEHGFLRIEGPSPLDGAAHLATTRDGGFLIAFPAPAPDGHHSYVARYDATGTLDASFGKDGGAFGGSAKSHVQTKVAVNGGGGIYLTDEKGVQRLRPDGTLDGAFGGGEALFRGGRGTGNEWVMTVDAEGAPILGGLWTTDTGTLDLEVARFGDDGSWQDDFGVNGTASLALGSSPAFVKTLPSGRILVVGAPARTGNTGWTIRATALCP